ncbi:hypothetical protein Dsin_012284 [Dipteronia sinensis]|uniref:RNase H type-1 domain-containing protein n=1 Tax=Dipteronia sinensis TaxID=43782 RepID=A0AAE0AJ26_9ROSI|nr:hypothetical protein Dsin_012284 [Dipteronia sinensis]
MLALEAGNAQVLHGCKYRHTNINGYGAGLSVAAGKSWYVPPTGCFKLNVDAAVITGGGRYGVGIVFRDDHGVVVEAAALSFIGTVSVEVAKAKAKAILEVLLFAEDMGLFPLMVESDALGVIKLCKEEFVSVGEIDNIISDIVSLKRNCNIVSFGYIPRMCNRVAHSVAKYAVNYNCLVVRFAEYPDCLTLLAKGDLYVCSQF